MSASSLANASNDLNPFIITMSARALFDLEESHQIFKEKGLKEFERYHEERINEPLDPGPLLGFAKKLFKFNDERPEGVRPFEVVLLSRNSTETALRVLNTIDKMKLPFIRAVFTGGEPSSTYVEAIGAHLFLSANEEEVEKVIRECGIAAATVYSPKDKNYRNSVDDSEIRIAFDGDAVVFGDDAEKVYGEMGLNGFQDHEAKNAHLPLSDGPFKSMLEAIHDIQECYEDRDQCPIKTALITARSMPAHMRAINTLKSWGLRINTAIFLGGRKKTPFLKAFKADLFFDDARLNVEHALEAGPAGHVPYGIRNSTVDPSKKFSGADEVGKVTVVGPSKSVVEEPLAPSQVKLEVVSPELSGVSKTRTPGPGRR